nr:uncharacterized protein si:dkey-224b4.5 isoform X2 [Danio rerio]XP_021326069.1 uncharacterized protein si:dkey-224b4.5 isoform X2 [Danio rerio]|eukprot:XP_021326067.1 uncharacterized protein si:dkey-224b4.5 isoform X2 [Danio rerio]
MHLWAEFEALNMNLRRGDDGYRPFKPFIVFKAITTKIYSPLKFYGLGLRAIIEAARTKRSDDGFRESWDSDLRRGDDGYRPFSLRADRKKVRIKSLRADRKEVRINSLRAIMEAAPTKRSYNCFRRSRYSEWLTEETASTKSRRCGDDGYRPWSDFNIHNERPQTTDFQTLLASFDLKRAPTSATHKSELLAKEEALLKMNGVSCQDIYVSGDAQSIDGDRPTWSDDGFRESWDSGRRCGDDGYRPWNEEYLDGQGKISIREIY